MVDIIKKDYMINNLAKYFIEENKENITCYPSCIKYDQLILNRNKIIKVELLK